MRLVYSQLDSSVIGLKLKDALGILPSVHIGVHQAGQDVTRA